MRVSSQVIKNHLSGLFSATLMLLLIFSSGSRLCGQEDEAVWLGGEGRTCNEDPHCINRLHPDIPMAARVSPGQMVVLKTRNASDFDLDPASTYDDPRRQGPPGSTVHPLTGPVHIEGAKAGNVLAVTLLDIAPGPYGYTVLHSIGFVADRFPTGYRVLWELNRKEARSEDLPGVRIPNGSFPGVVTTLPGPAQLKEMLAREQTLADAHGVVSLPQPVNATPAEVCGPQGSAPRECLRTIPPREHGGNVDIRYLRPGVTVYLPCYIDGCGLAVGDLHFAQGDGEVSGTAIEMDAAVTLTTEIVRDGPNLERGIHFEGPATALHIPSRRFYATTGFPLKEKGQVPPDMQYLQSGKVAGLENLSKDISLAARNALLAMIEHISTTYDLTPEQAYLVCSVAVDLRIAQLVDSPNVGVTALLPVDIFTGR
ncbi:MAG TPA: acetamidase/formamidase family protein [Acidobacteriota bacterium]|nr:acetamidase/formamidase family protein [Acidobacteriota bacterium]